MIEEPGCTAGSVISDNPARGPMLSRRRSFAIFPSSIASRRMALEYASTSPALRDAEQVRGRLQRETGITREVGDNRFPVLVAGIQPGADCGGADVQFLQLLRRPRDIVGPATEAFGVPAELLTERHRHRILEMGAAGLEHSGKRVGLP